MKKGDASLIVFMVATFCYLSHVTAIEIVPIETTAGVTDPPYTPTCLKKVDMGTNIVRVSNSIWKGGISCGMRLRVTCSGPVTDGVTNACKDSSSYVDVTIIDLCAECEEGTFKLSKEAFDVIANEEADRVKVNYFGLLE